MECKAERKLTMEISGKNRMMIILYTLLFSGFDATALPYDYTASIECLKTPLRALYGGGIIINPEFDKGSEGWEAFGEAKIELRELVGNKFIAAHARNQTSDSISQKLNLQHDMLYSFSAWIQVSEGNESVAAVFRTATGFKRAGAVVAESKCWSMLKGGFTSDSTGQAELYFEIRKSNVRIQAVDKQNNPLPNAMVSVQQKRPGFPIGCAMNKNILTNTAYQNWFTSRFMVTTFEDEMKWYSTEGSLGHEDYSWTDALLSFTKKHNIEVRGHNVVWNDPKYQPGWLYSLSRTDLSKAVVRRVKSVMSRYKGQLIAWDVVNENLHFSFFESRLGNQASGDIYRLAHAFDQSVPLFLNEYNTIEDSRDGAAAPAKYLQKLRQIQAWARNASLGIGLESHFNTPNLAYMRAAIDTLAATGLPIWLTEVDVQSGPNQARYLEHILMEAHSHPKVDGIVIWAAWRPQGCYRMCLTDNNFRNLATGNVVDNLLRQWRSEALFGSTDSEGFLETSLFHGDYEVNITHPSSSPHSLGLFSTNTSLQSQVTFQVTV